MLVGAATRMCESAPTCSNLRFDAIQEWMLLQAASWDYRQHMEATVFHVLAAAGYARIELDS